MEGYDNKFVFSNTMPREKLLSCGVGALRDEELLAILLQTGIANKSVLELASEMEQIIRQKNGKVGVSDLKKIKGVGEAKALKVIASIEYARRLDSQASRKVKSVEDVVKIASALAYKKQEHFMLITLNGAGMLIQTRIVFVGTLNRSIAHPREIFAHAIRDRAATIIISHNHPSGEVEPSDDDILLTDRMKAIGELLDIKLLDHVIIGKEKHYSFVENERVVRSRLAGLKRC